MENHETFSLGDLVVLKSHPLLYSNFIKGDGKFVPPIMIVIEIQFEGKQKKTHDDITGERISEKIKYCCIYFDDNRGEFHESYFYHSTLSSVSKLIISDTNYPKDFKYNFGSLVYFKSKRIETLKMRTSKIKTITIDHSPKEDNKQLVSPKEKILERETLQNIVSFSTPDFISTGFKKEILSDQFYNNGQRKKENCSDFIKVKWYNPIQQKFSEQFIPSICFTSINPFDN